MKIQIIRLILGIFSFGIAYVIGKYTTLALTLDTKTLVVTIFFCTSIILIGFSFRED